MDFQSMTRPRARPTPTCRLVSSICTIVMGIALLVGCERAATSPHPWLARLDTGPVAAACRPGRGPAWQVFARGEAEGIGFRQKPGTTCRFDLPIPADATVTFALRAAGSERKARGEARVAVAVLRDGEPRVARSFDLAPGEVVAVDALELGEGGGNGLVLIHEGGRRAVPVEWTGLSLSASTPDDRPPAGWTRPYAAAVGAFADEAGWPRPSAARRRLLVLGIDGASWPLLDELIAAGEVPHLAELARRGLRGRLASTFIPESAMSWTSIRTGVTPGRHGVHHFLSPDTARWSYWKWLDAAGLRSIVVGVPKSSPDEPFDGVLVGGWDFDVRRPYARPASLAARLADTGYDPTIANVADVARFATRMRARTDLAVALLARCDWDHAFVVYEYGDTAGHRFGLRTDGWRAAYRALDHEVGRLLAALPTGASVLVVSDHGWRRFTRAFAPGPWLEANGFTDWAPHVYGGHRVALRPKHPLEPEAEAGIVDRLRGSLLAVRDPDTGAPVVARVLPFAEGLPGPFGERSRDRLFVELEPDYHAAGKAADDAIWPAGPADHHDVEGMYLLVDPDVAPGTGRDASVVDVAPTVAAFFGVTPPGDLDGRPIVELTATRPQTRTPAIGAREAGDRDAGDEATPSPELRERLRALGYIDEGGG